MLLNSGYQILSIRDKIVNILEFWGLIISVTITQIFHYTEKLAMDNGNGCGYDQYNFIY